MYIYLQHALDDSEERPSPIYTHTRTKCDRLFYMHACISTCVWVLVVYLETLNGDFTNMRNLVGEGFDEDIHHCGISDCQVCCSLSLSLTPHISISGVYLSPHTKEFQCRVCMYVTCDDVCMYTFRETPTCKIYQPTSLPPTPTCIIYQPLSLSLTHTQEREGNTHTCVIYQPVSSSLSQECEGNRICTHPKHPRPTSHKKYVVTHASWSQRDEQTCIHTYTKCTHKSQRRDILRVLKRSTPRFLPYTGKVATTDRRTRHWMSSAMRRTSGRSDASTASEPRVSMTGPSLASTCDLYVHVCVYVW